MFEAGTRVPLIVSGAGINQGQVSEALVSHIDFMATFADMLSHTLPEGQGIDSRSALDALKGVDKQGREYVIEQATGLSVTTGEWKYIEPNKGARYSHYTNTEMGNDTIPQLYNLRQDVNEQQNMAEENTSKVEELKAILTKERAVK